MNLLVTYLLTFSDQQVTRKEILDYLDTRPEVKNWFAFLPASILIVSDTSVQVLTNLLCQRFPGKNFLITGVPVGQNNGWLAQNVWDFINNPKSTGRWP
jgi:hypothetical protein